MTKIKQMQLAMLKTECERGKVDFDSMKSLLESVRVKKLIKRNNYHQLKINDEIENALK